MLVVRTSLSEPQDDAEDGKEMVVVVVVDNNEVDELMKIINSASIM